MERFGSAKRTSPARRAGLPGRIFALLLVVAGVLALAACNVNDVFAKYQSVNLIGSSQFRSGDWTADQTSPYMTFTSVSASAAGSTTGLPSGGDKDIYRLAVDNLFPNGDFEATPLGNPPANWTASGASTFSATASGAINGRSMTFSVPGMQSLAFDLSTVLDGFVAGAIYSLHFEFTTTGSELYDEYSDNMAPGTVLKSWTTKRAATGAQQFPPSTNPDNSIIADASLSPAYFTINTQTTDKGLKDGVIDNITLVRSDIPLALRLEVPVVDSAGTRLPLVDGTYQFSVWVMTDPANSLTGSGPITDNLFPATAITLGLNHVVRNSIVSSEPSQVFHPADTSGGNWDKWTQLTWEVSGVQVSVPSADEPYAYVELTISTTDTATGATNVDAGSVLVSSPQLKIIGN